MKTKLVPHGDELALVLEPAFWETLGFDEDTLLDMRVEGGRIVVRPQDDDVDEAE